MRRTIGISAIALVALVGCAPPPPANEMERRARLAAAAEVAAQNCAGQLGGFSSAREMRADADRNMALARQLGATDADIANARAGALTTFNGAVFWTSPRDACNQLVGAIAWQTG